MKSLMQSYQDTEAHDNEDDDSVHFKPRHCGTPRDRSSEQRTLLVQVILSWASCGTGSRLQEPPSCLISSSPRVQPHVAAIGQSAASLQCLRYAFECRRLTLH